MVELVEALGAEAKSGRHCERQLLDSCTGAAGDGCFERTCLRRSHARAWGLILIETWAS